LRLEKKTPLYDTHVRLGGKLVAFAGFLLPVQYSGITAEHMAVRTAAGLFDVSHMGEILLTGPDALNNIQMLVTNDCSGMADGQVKYSPMCNKNGGVIDDLLVYRHSETKYLLVVNAANHDKDAAWIQANLSGDVRFDDVSAQTAQIALQGPGAAAIASRLTATLPEKNYTFLDGADVGGVRCLVSRTGYTGEDGFEFYMANEDAPRLWDKLIETGACLGLVPCGLGARDTLRLEAAMPLYGHEMDDETTPLESGVGFFVKMNKADFIGKAAIEAKGTPRVKRIGLEVLDRGIARGGDTVLADGKEIGRVTSGTMCPFVKKAVAMALVDARNTAASDIQILSRGKALDAKEVPLPFYKINK